VLCMNQIPSRYGMNNNLDDVNSDMAWCLDTRYGALRLGMQY